MDKSNKNIIEAGITPAEFDDLFAGDFRKIIKPIKSV